MPNAIKYSTTGDTLSIKKGNIFFGVGDVGKGPSSATTYYNGVTPSAGGYTIYSYNASQTSKLSFHTAVDDAALRDYTNRVSGQSFASAAQCLNWYATQSDYACVNRDYEGIVTSGLTFCLDAGFTPSYTTSGTTWYDLGYNGNNGTLTNGPTFNSDNGGSIVFDGVDDYSFFGNPSSLQFNNSTFSYGCWFYWVNTNTEAILMGKRDGATTINVPSGSNYNQYGLTIAETMCCGPAGKKIGAYLACDGGSVQGGSLIADLPNFVGWVYSIVTVGTTEQKLYINGILSSTTNQNFTGQTFKIVGRSFYIGCTGGNTEGSIILPFNGRISSAQIYNKTLSSTEVLQNYNAGLSRFSTDNIIKSGLVLNLDAGINPSYPSSGIKWNDLSGFGYHGTLTNGPTFNSSNGGSIVFDGTNDYVQVTSPFGDIDWSSRSWTISAWMRLDAMGDRCLVNLNSSNSSHYIVTNVFYGGYSYWYFIKNSTPTQTNFTQTSANFTTNEIFHFTMTYNGNGLSNGNISFYKNGTLLTTTGGGSAGLSNQSGLQIGGNYFLDGNVYNFLMWNKSLSSTEVLQNYNAQKSRFGL